MKEVDQMIKESDGVTECGERPDGGRRGLKMVDVVLKGSRRKAK